MTGFDEMSARHVALLLPDQERALLRSLVAPWHDLLYSPGPGLTSSLDPGAYRTSLVIVPAAGPAVRVSSTVTPAFGAELCRLRVETLPHAAPSSFGSFFDPTRTGTVYALTPEPGVAAARAPERAGWRYDGASLAPRLGRVGGMRLLRERGRDADGSWEADRGLALTGADGGPSLVLAVPEPAEATLFLPSPGLYRLLLDPEAPTAPGVTVRDLLGHGDRSGGMDSTVELVAV
ncbi:MAG TPA: hypothetical protein VIG07_10965 [Methylomirabilota bacterium]